MRFYYIILSADNKIEFWKVHIRYVAETLFKSKRVPTFIVLLQRFLPNTIQKGTSGSLTIDKCFKISLKYRKHQKHLNFSCIFQPIMKQVLNYGNMSSFRHT